MNDQDPMSPRHVVIVLQHENWEDDGGDHDPVLITLTKAQFDVLEAAHTGRVIDDTEVDALRDLIHAAPVPALPCTIHAVFNFWYS